MYSITGGLSKRVVSTITMLRFHISQFPYELK